VGKSSVSRIAIALHHAPFCAFVLQMEGDSLEIQVKALRSLIDVYSVEAVVAAKPMQAYVALVACISGFMLIQSPISHSVAPIHACHAPWPMMWTGMHSPDMKVSTAKKVALLP